jgi:hypothetical protein
LSLATPNLWKYQSAWLVDFLHVQHPRYRSREGYLKSLKVGVFSWSSNIESNGARNLGYLGIAGVMSNGVCAE